MKQSNRRSYLSDFKRTADGSYVYEGKHYRFCVPAKAQRGLRLRLALGCAAAAAAVIGSGCINAAGMSNTFYVILPFAAEVSALFALCWQTGRLLAAGERMRAYVFEPVHRRLPLAALLLSIFSLLSLACAGLYLGLHGWEGKPLLSLLYLALKAVGAALGLLLRRYFLRLPYETA